VPVLSRLCRWVPVPTAVSSPWSSPGPAVAVMTAAACSRRGDQRGRRAVRRRGARAGGIS